jgi:hypothetical protein
LENCDLSNLGYRALNFTWSNCQDVLNFIKEWLDREVANSSWKGLFLDIEIVVEVIAYSDHTPLSLCLHGHEVRGRGRKNFFMKSSGFWRGILIL